ncbi:hypothetical protein NJC40_27850 [Pseudomonas sp. 21LCFQ02]|uniref:hypothetical protein n=1 Tax=unclassified Pseudomonas TaxID=196821 RepID=UPI0004F637EB|nr:MULTISPECIES: hypothetical protein [unclassified Pseudomonas]MCO8164497.1 hypothetical protein [Pseudomonas sp. 21LCFQ010]MCO8171585.1 hypothetical protein [Pseudomonas sp. 21LCFQ02]MCQ9424699.1 hypothetical protein [Pseudomonas sp. LJDD11]BAP41178.1 hypothetical protein PSCI_0476 [Pseudomonas sp. StFLB209]
MKIDSKPIGQDAAPLNEIGLLAWSLLADEHLNMVGGGIPGQPTPDTPQPDQPQEPGVPTVPDEPPPAPVA